MLGAVGADIEARRRAMAAEDGGGATKGSCVGVAGALSRAAKRSRIAVVWCACKCAIEAEVVRSPERVASSVAIFCKRVAVALLKVWLDKDTAGNGERGVVAAGRDNRLVGGGVGVAEGLWRKRCSCIHDIRGMVAGRHLFTIGVRE